MNARSLGKERLLEGEAIYLSINMLFQCVACEKAQRSGRGKS
jgi:hypothetical protein